jgi:iron(III) transport system permease protein
MMRVRRLAAGQPGLGVGGALTLLALLMLLGCGLAATGKFRGDAFVAGAVVLCAALLLLFVALPVAVALAGAFVDEAGRFSLAAVAERLGHERIWGLRCLAGGVRCGVAWNTLFLALLTAFGTTVLGTMLALVAERGARRLEDAGAPALGAADHHAAVRRRPRPDPAVRPRRHRQPAARVGVRRHADALVLRPAGPLAGAAVRVHADRLPDHARRRRGVAPSLEEAAQTLRADRWTTLRTVTLPLLKPGWPTPSWSASSRASPTSATRSSSAASTACSRPTCSSRSSARSSTRPRRLARARALGVRARRLPAAAEGGRPAGYTTVSGKGDAGVPMRLPAGLSRAMLAVVLPWLAFTDRRLPVRVRRRLRRDLGPRLHADAAPLRHRVRPAVGRRRRGRRPGLGRHRVELALHDAQARRARRAGLRACSAC